MKTSAMALLLMVLLAGPGGCSRSDRNNAASQITGTISYRAPVRLAAGTVLEVRLTDVSVSDGPALEVAKATVPNPDALPYRYTLPYDANKISAQHRYTVDARISTAGELRFSTDTAYAVLTQGQGTQRDLTVIAIGESAPAAINPGSAPIPDNSPDVVIFQSEMRTGSTVSLYKAGIQDGRIVWIEEDRSTSSPAPLHARYDLKGALMVHYVDSSPLEIRFDERGRVLAIIKDHQTLAPGTQAGLINEVRNRAALLRSHALATSEARTHRQATGG